jgi:acyl carrier protein
MTKETIDSEVRNLLALVLETTIPPNEPVSRETEPKWNSLKQVELIFALEDAFSVRFAENEMPQLTSIAAIVSMIEKHRASA